MIRYYQIPLQWQDISIENKKKRERIRYRLMMCFFVWENTPYMAGNQQLSSGVDCVRWISAVLDEMYQRWPTNIKTLPSDASFHNRLGAIKAMHQIRKLYPNCITIRNGIIEPGDLIVIGPPGGGPGHALLVGTEPNTLWHCTPNSGVTRTGWSLIVGQQQIYRVYRAKDRDKLWI